jgi:hypothetical protein
MAENEWTKKERVRMATLDRIVLEDESYNLTVTERMDDFTRN